jgi:hypothetical protein
MHLEEEINSRYQGIDTLTRKGWTKMFYAQAYPQKRKRKSISRQFGQSL